MKLNEVTMAFLIPIELRLELEAAAEKQYVSMSWIIRQAIREYLETHSK